MLCNAAGRGFIELQQVAGKTAVTQCRANTPLKLLTPTSPGPNAWIFTSTYGGGLLDGDAIDLHLDAGPDTRCLLTTQASTKVYRSQGIGSRQSLAVNAQRGAVVVSMPDPIVCFEGANFDQHQRFALAEDSALLMVDWFTSGRKARGERWLFDRYRSHTQIMVQERCIFRDILLLDTAAGSIAGPMRMGTIDCFATAVVVGAVFQNIAGDLLDWSAAEPARAQSGILFSASPVQGGAVLRVAGPETELVAHWLKKKLEGVETILGQNPWDQKI